MDPIFNLLRFPRVLAEMPSLAEHPKGKKYYSATELCEYAKFFKEPLFERHMDSSYYKEKIQQYDYEIRENWRGKEPAATLINNSLDLMFECYSQRKHKRKDGTPLETHPLAVAYHLDKSHSTALEVATGALHDIIEDSKDGILNYSYTNPVSLSIALAKNPPKTGGATLELLVSAVAWGTVVLTNKKPLYVRQKLRKPQDIHTMRAFLYQEDKYLLYKNYMRKIYDEQFLFPAKVKAVDGYENTLSLAQLDAHESKKYFDLIFTTSIKKIIELDIEKKWKYTITYQALQKNLPKLLSLMKENFPSIEDIFTLENLVKNINKYTEFPINIYSLLERHRFEKSRTQKFYEHMGAILSNPRTDMGIDLLRQQPYARSPVIVIMAEESDYERVSHKPIEIGLPRHIGTGDPEVASNFVEIDREKASGFYRRMLNNYNLPFDVSIAPSAISGYDGMDFIILRLNFSDGENPAGFASYLGGTPSARLLRYQEIIDILLRESQQLARANFAEVLKEGQVFTRQN